MMLVRDSSGHTRLRGLVSKAFTAVRIEALRERTHTLAERPEDEVEHRGEMDIIAESAAAARRQRRCSAFECGRIFPARASLTARITPRSWARYFTAGPKTSQPSPR